MSGIMNDINEQIGRIKDVLTTMKIGRCQLDGHLSFHAGNAREHLDRVIDHLRGWLKDLLLEREEHP